MKKPLILGILFFLPVVFLLFLYPATENYNPLDIVNTNVLEISEFTSDDGEILLKDHLTVLGFLGYNPSENALPALNLKEIIYDKFKGFKKFQVVILVPNGSQDYVKELEKELYNYDELKYWHFLYGTEEAIKRIHSSLKTETSLKKDLSTEFVFIIDKDLSQRGRLDDREKVQIEKNKPKTTLFEYNCIEVAELKNKMAKEDMRILFTEYRQKRKGTYDSSTRRENDLKATDEEN